MGYFPLFLKTTDAPVALIGGGAVALAKAETLLASGARLRVVAPDILPLLAAHVNAAGGTLHQEAYAPHHLEGAAFVIAATDDPALNARIHADAKALGLLINVVDTPELCDFIFPAVVARGEVQVAVSTAGISPTLARLIKRTIEQALPWNLAALAEWIETRKDRVKKHFPNLQARRLFWEEALEGAIAQEVLEGNHFKAERLFAQALEEQPAAARAALWLVGAGAGHADLITVQGARMLGQADVILYDRLVAGELLARYARKDALKLPVGKERGDHRRTQAEIGELLREHLSRKRIVVRLKGGDPGVYAHAAEEIAVAAALSVPWQICPGVTAALACAAHAGIPLTERGGANAVRFLTLYDEQLRDRDFWRSLALSRHETLVFYMSTARRAALAEKLLEAGFAPDTPMLLIEQGATPFHREYASALKDFAALHGAREFITPTLLIVGGVVGLRETQSWREEPREQGRFFESRGAA